MSFRVNRANLLQVLDRVAPGLSPKEFIEQSSCVIFDRGWVNTFNDEICVKSKSGLPDELYGAVPAKVLTLALECIPDEEITLDADGSRLHIRAGRKKVNILMRSEVLLPVDLVEVPSKADWSDLPVEFPAAIDRVLNTIGTDDADFCTVCINFHPKWVETCDLVKATRFYLDLGMLSEPFLVRAKSMAQLAPMGIGRIAVTENWVHFRAMPKTDVPNSGSTIFSCRRYVEQFPSDTITKLLDFRGDRITLPKGAAVAAKLGGIFSSEDRENDRVTVVLSDGFMTVKGSGSVGDSSHPEPINDYRGEPVSFRIAPKGLIDLVKEYETVEIGPSRLLVDGGEWKFAAILGKAEDGDDPVAVPVGAGEEEPEEQEEDNASDE